MLIVRQLLLTTQSPGNNGHVWGYGLIILVFWYVLLFSTNIINIATEFATSHPLTAESVFLCAVGTWGLARRTKLEAVHMFYYSVACLWMVNVVAVTFHFIEKLSPLSLLERELPSRPDIYLLVSALQLTLRAAHFLLSWLWVNLHLNYDRLILLCQATTVGVVGFGYAISAPASNHSVPSPLTLSFIVLKTCLCLFEMIPLLPIMAFKILSRAVFGEPLVDTIAMNYHHIRVLSPLWLWRSSKLRARLRDAKTYEEYLDCREQLDRFEGREAWKNKNASRFYQYDSIERAIELIRKARTKLERRKGEGVREFSQMLISVINRNYAYVCSPFNFRFPGVGTKKLIQEFIEELEEQVRYITDTEFPSSSFSLLEKKRFLAGAQHAVGETALCLSGGGALAMYHMGLAFELHRFNMLPRVISGTSGGAIVAGLLGCRTDEELTEYIREDVSTRFGQRWFDPFSGMLKRFFKEGVIVDSGAFLDVLGPITGNFTFQEAYERTGRILNITVSCKELGDTSLLNHLITPDVLVRSAVAASCALTGVMKPQQLLCKTKDGEIVPLRSAGAKYRDGTFSRDIPMQELSSLFHVSHFIVSQANPHIALFLRDRTKPISPLSAVQQLLLVDIRNRLDKAYRLGLLPQEAHILVRQSYLGEDKDINMWPRLRLSDLLWRVLAHPSVEDMKDFMRGGQRMTWPHLYRIKCQTRIERTLEECASRLGTPSLHTVISNRKSLSVNLTPVEKEGGEEPEKEETARRRIRPRIDSNDQ